MPSGFTPLARTKIRQKSCRSYFRAPESKSAKRDLFNEAIFATETTIAYAYCLYLIHLIFRSVVMVCKQA